MKLYTGLLIITFILRIINDKGGNKSVRKWLYIELTTHRSGRFSCRSIPCHRRLGRVVGTHRSWASLWRRRHGRMGLHSGRAHRSCIGDNLNWNQCLWDTIEVTQRTGTLILSPFWGAVLCTVRVGLAFVREGRNGGAGSPGQQELSVASSYFRF